MGNKVGVGEIFRFLEKMGENGKGGPLGHMEDIGDFEDLGRGEWRKTPRFHLLIYMALHERLYPYFDLLHTQTLG
eukprot:SAG31_NODE_92_length_26360_cov_29.601881_14_plen_75_part_00